MTSRTEEIHELRMTARAALWEDYALKGPEAGLRWTDPEQQETLYALVGRWLETSDPQFMDSALLYCLQEKLPILPSLLEHVAASVRVRQALKPAKKVVNESVKGQALRVMANLVARGFTNERASEVAAVWTADQGGRLIKAGTLERDFKKGDWDELAADIREMIPEWNEPAREAQWLAGERNCRAITDEEKGNRR